MGHGAFVVLSSLCPSRFLAAVIASADRLAIGQHLKNQNTTSVVLHVDAGHCAALLGADLEMSPNTHGWRAIAMNRLFDLEGARVAVSLR